MVLSQKFKDYNPTNIDICMLSCVVIVSPCTCAIRQCVELCNTPFLLNKHDEAIRDYCIDNYVPG